MGPPGAGKGTQGQRLCQHFPNGRFFSTGALLREAALMKDEIGLKIEQVLASGGMVPTSLNLSILERVFRDSGQAQPIILDFAGDYEQCIELEKMSARYGYQITHMFLLEAPLEQLTRRLIDRRRADDSEAMIAKRVELYEQTMPEVVDYYEKTHRLHRINGQGSPNEVTERLLAVLREDSK